MATNTKATVNDVLQIVSDLRGESSVNTDASRIRAVSRAEKDFSRRHNWRIFILPDQTQTGDGTTSNFTVGSVTYPYRSTGKGLIEVFVGGTTEDKRYGVVDFLKYKNEYNKNNSTKLAYEWYDVANDLWKVKINPTPENGAVMTYSYTWEPPTRTSTSDAVLCPSLDILARLALAYTYEGEDEDKYQEELALAEIQIAELVAKENSPAPNQLYAMGAIENSIRPRGFGTY